MNEQEIVEGNKLIAEFMGDPVSVTMTEGKKRYTTLYNIGQVKDWNEVNLWYHESWNALMPVVEKIATIIIKKRIPYGPEGGVFVADEFMSVRIFAPIGTIYTICINFIKYYNSKYLKKATN